MVSRNQLVVGLVVAGAAAALGWYAIVYRRRRRSRRGSRSVVKRNAHGIVTFHSLDNKFDLKLVQKTEVSPNTRLFRFQLHSDDHVVGLKPGQHVLLSANIDGKVVERKYTPVSSDDELVGYVELVIKIYPANVHPNYPKGGTFSQHLETLKIGDTVTFSGPVTKITYEGNGHFLVRPLGTKDVHSRNFKRLGIVVGGTGITPMLQIINVILKNPNDPTEIWMLFANNTPADVLLKDKLDRLAVDYEGRFRVWYTVSVPDDDWKYSVGHVDEEMLAKHIPPAHPEVGVAMCGPPGLKNKAVVPNLLKLGFAKEQILDF